MLLCQRQSACVAAVERLVGLTTRTVAQYFIDTFKYIDYLTLPDERLAFTMASP